MRGRRARRTGRAVTLYSVTPWAGVALVIVMLFSILRGGDAGAPVEIGRTGTLGRGEPVVKVWNTQTARVRDFPVDEYVLGVVAAELPAGFHPEAMKAQAVAARTYALRRVERNDRLSGQGNAHVTTDYRTHQSWTDKERFLAERPAGVGQKQWETLAAAVEATRGVVLVHGGELIDAMYHSTSGGHTEDAARYFNSPIPYLTGVRDPYGDHSPVHRTREQLSIHTVMSRLGVRSANQSIKVIRRSPAGRVDEVTVGGQTFTGRQVREALNLQSNWFDVETRGEMVTFHVRGSGHGVGMPQYGADGMARDGYSYEQILTHYYPGARLVKRY